MSILDSVLDAERRAEQHRTKAQSEVKDLLELTRINLTLPLSLTNLFVKLCTIF